MTAPISITPHANGTSAWTGTPTDPAQAYQQQRLADGEACLTAALDLLAHGCPVLALCPPDHVGMGRKHGARCNNPGKVPWHCWAEYQPDGRGRLPTADEVRAWWRQHPSSNIGLALGKQVRIDVEGPEAETRLAEVSCGDLPTTWAFRSGREDGTGRGLLYQLPPGEVFRTKREGLPLGGELRLQAIGAQTVLPPSRHRSGRRYAWVPGHSPDDVGIAPAPAWLLEALREGARHKAVRKPRPAGPATNQDDRALALAALAGLSPERAEAYDSWLQVGMALHAVSDDDDMLGAWDEWSALCPGKYDPGVCETKWATFSDDGGITLGSLIHWAREDGWTPPERGTGDGIDLGNLRLVPGKAHQTPSGKVVLPVRLWRDGVCFDQLQLSTSPHGRKEAAAALRRHVPDGEAQVEEAINKLIAVALRSLEEQAAATREGRSLREVLRDHVQDRYRPRHRLGRRVWLDQLGEAVDRAGFVCLLNNDMLEAARLAADVSEEADRYALTGRVETELRLLFGDLLGSLCDRRTEEAPLHAAERTALAECVIAMWSRVVALTKTKTTTGGVATETTRNVSLVEQVKALARDKKVKPGKWQQVHPGHAAYVTLLDRAAEDGEVLGEEVALGFNAELSHSTSVRLPDGITFFNLKKTGKKAGLFRDLDGIPSRAERNTVRLIVLSSGFAACLLEDVTADSLEDTSCGHKAQNRPPSTGSVRAAEPAEGDFVDSCGHVDS